MLRLRGCVFLVSLLMILVVGAGCGSDDPDPLVPVDAGLPFPGSEDQLMANFVTAYEDMDIDSYRDLLHPDYKMILQPTTVASYPDLGPDLDRDEELRSAGRMFAGEPVTDPDGVSIPATGSISVDVLAQQGAWAVSLPDDAIPNTRFGNFEVIFRWDRPGFASMMVSGTVRFYVAGRDSLHEGSPRIYWQLLGVLDLTDSFRKGSELDNWGSVKALWR